MTWNMSDERIEQALSQSCGVCGVNAGDECVGPISGKPLLEERGRPVHARRLEI